MRAQISGADGCLCDQCVEMLGKNLDPVAVAKGHILRTDIQPAEQWAENGQRCRIQHSGIEQIDADPRIKLLA